ncbi:MAG: hypothetical protein U0Q18_30845 [Bryobacteraceae bacterium]
MVPVLAAAAAFAQQPGPDVSIERQAGERARKLLASPLYLEKAWGAFLAGKYRLQDCTPDLLTQMAAMRDAADSSLREDTPEFAAIQATLDALIQLGHSVNSSTVAPYFARYPNEVLILLARDPSANGEALLKLAQDDLGDRQWAAIYNLLVQVRNPGVAAQVLAAVRIRHVFHVTDGVHFRGSGGGTGGGVLCSAFALAPGFPPTGFYELVESPQTGDVMLAGGRHPVYYRRTTVPSAHSTAHDRRLQLVDRDGYRMDYLAWLSDGLPCRLEFPEAGSSEAGSLRRNLDRLGRCCRLSPGGDHCDFQAASD